MNHPKTPEEYIRRIRNANKKLFAMRYMAYLRNGGGRLPDRGSLSLMAEQAVRYEINRLEEAPTD